MQGFREKILDDCDEHKWYRTISYMSDLMKDVIDFSWQNAKDAHTISSELERDTSTWNDTA